MARTRARAVTEARPAWARGLRVAGAGIRVVVAAAGYWFYLRSTQIQAANAERALMTLGMLATQLCQEMAGGF